MPYAVPINAPVSVRIENKDLRTLALELTAYPSELLFPPVRQRHVSIAGRPGSYSLGDIFDDWNFSLNFALHGTSHKDAMKKLDEFKRWIDLAQHYSAEWLVGQRSIKALKFEMAGHRYYYTEGSVSVTNGSATITGSSTYWLSYAKPGVEFTVQDDPTPGPKTRYIIKSVESDTSLTLTANIARANGSSLTYEIERRRYLLVNYNGTSSISQLARGHFKDYQYNISVSFKSNYPFWVGDEFEITQSSVSAGTFLKLRGVGTSAHNPLYQIVGAASSPKIIASDFSFNARFWGNVKYRDIENLTDKDAATFTYNQQFISAQYNQGVSFRRLAGASNYLRFHASIDESTPSSVITDRFNANQGMISLLFKPYFNYDSIIDDEHFLFYVSANYFLKYDRNVSRFKCRFGHSQDIGLACPDFDAGDWLNITIGWNDTDNDLLAVIRNLTDITRNSTSSSVTITGANPSQYIYIGNDSSLKKPANGVIDDFSIYSIYDATFADNDFSAFERHNDRAMDYLNDYLLAHFLLDGSGNLVESDNHGCCRQLTLVASAYDGIDTFTFTKNANEVFRASEKICIWSSGSTNVYYDTVSTISSTSMVVSTGGALTLTGTIYVSKNLLADANMELANTSYWTANNATLAKETSTVKQDTRSLKITNTAALLGWARQTVTTVSGQCYKVSGYFYPPSTLNNASYVISCDLDIDKSITVTQANLTGSEWNYVELVFQADDSSATIDFSAGSITSAEFCYWDCARMYQMDGGISNAGMEDL